MSLLDRARLAVLAEMDGDPALRGLVLGAIGTTETRLRSGPRRARETPDRWTPVHVLDRLEEAYQVLASLPAATRPKAYGNAMPTIAPDTRLSLLDQVLMMQSGQLDEIHDDRNRVRTPPSTAQITRMDEALRWPFDHLRDSPALGRAIGLRALWGAMGVDIRKRCEKVGLHHRLFNVEWHEALTRITRALVAGKVPVT